MGALRALEVVHGVSRTVAAGAQLAESLDPKHHPHPQVVGRVRTDEPLAASLVSFERVLLLADGRLVGEASTGRDGSFEVIGTLDDGRYELVLASDRFEAAAPVYLEGCRPARVELAARRR